MEFFEKFLGSIFGFGEDAADAAILVADKVVNAKSNEIKFDNFIVQGKANGILMLNPTCNESNGKPDLKDAYYTLYYYLITKNIITAFVDKTVVVTGDRVNIVNKKLAESPEKMESLLNASQPDFPEPLKCYTIDIKKLSDFLKNYKYNAGDEIELITGSGEHKTRRVRKKRSKSKRRR
jgi:hypothetical protein